MQRLIVASVASLASLCTLVDGTPQNAASVVRMSHVSNSATE